MFHACSQNPWIQDDFPLFTSTFSEDCLTFEEWHVVSLSGLNLFSTFPHSNSNIWVSPTEINGIYPQFHIYNFINLHKPKGHIYDSIWVGFPMTGTLPVSCHKKHNQPTQGYNLSLLKINNPFEKYMWKCGNQPKIVNFDYTL